jgi:hypothetical protein
MECGIEESLLFKTPPLNTFERLLKKCQMRGRSFEGDGGVLSYVR